MKRYRLKHNMRFRVGVTSFELPAGTIATSTQADPENWKVLLDFGGRLVDWFHVSVLDNFEEMTDATSSN